MPMLSSNNWHIIVPSFVVRLPYGTFKVDHINDRWMLAIRIIQSAIRVKSSALSTPIDNNVSYCMTVISTVLCCIVYDTVVHSHKHT